jgi:hypothetical protein
MTAQLNAHQKAILRETAYRRAADVTATRVEHAIEQLDAMNFGAAREILDALVQDGLPNHHGGPVTHYPIFETILAESVERRQT